MNKNILGWLLVCCLVVPMAATFTFLHFQKVKIRKELKHKMIAGLDIEELVLLQFSKAEALSLLDWEHDKEFAYDGEMYDVVETTVKGDSIFYRCWWDHAETALNKRLDGLLTIALGNDANKEDKQVQLTDFFKKLIPVDSPLWQSVNNACKQSSFAYVYKPSNVFISPPSPPPQLS